MTTRIFHLSDPHFGVEDRTALAQFADAVARERPDAVLCTGDITQRATHAQFDAAAHYFGGFSLPVVLCAGNHDMPYYSPWERFTDPYRRFWQLDARIGGAFESADVVLVPLVTTVRAQPRFPWSDGFVRRAALDAALARLHDLHDDRRRKLVICHHPLLGPHPERRNPTIGGDRAFAEIAAAGADAVVSGHIHVPFDLTPARGGHALRMIGAGTMSTRLRGAPPGYQVISCGPGGPIEVEQRILAG